MSQVLLEVICSQADICFAFFMYPETLTFSSVLIFPLRCLPLLSFIRVTFGLVAAHRERKKPLLLINTYILKALMPPHCVGMKNIFSVCSIACKLSRIVTAPPHLHALSAQFIRYKWFKLIHQSCSKSLCDENVIFSLKVL